MSFPRTRSACAAALLALPLPTFAQEAPTAKTASPIETPELAVKKFSVAPGLQVDVWAGEPLLINPVAFCFDEKGRALVVETGRRKTSVPDIRAHEPWQLENLNLRSVADRIAFLQRKYPETEAASAGADQPASKLADLNKDGRKDWRDLAVESERIKLLWDTDGDGHADASSVFADGFQTLATGTAAGVAAQGGTVWLACVPDLWRFDAGKNGAPPTRTALLTGFGVHVAFGGHDLHGTKIGPDGRLYWSVADCGARVTTREGKLLENPDSGAVFRCEPDGSNAELVATGLRNPQSLAWNEVGDLFTGDNNADGGDAARWTHVVEGADYGWRIGWQFLPRLGAWNAEGQWRLDVDQTNYAILPPVAHLGHGPAGIAYYPGTGLPEAYRGHFLCADFPGGVRAFALKARGASYEVALDKKFQQDNSAQQMTGKLLWGLYPSDVQFGPEGGAYVLDWVYGWEKTGKGRIYRVHDPAVDASPLVQETRRLLGEGMAQRSPAEMAALLGHADQRVRLAAQFALAEGNQPATLLTAALTGTDLAQLHGIWGLGQWERLAVQRHWEKAGSFAPALLPLLDSPTAEARAQAAKILGETRPPEAAAPLLRLLQDAEPRVRFFAAQALAKLGGDEAVGPLLAMLRQNDNRDSYVRHAGVLALAHCAAPAALAALRDDEALAVRTAGLLALRRQRRAEVAVFLADKNPQLVLEAARAIHDTPIPAALPELAQLIGRDDLPPALSRRVINANYRLGLASALADFAARQSDASNPAQEAARLDALGALAEWNNPAPMRDRVLGVLVDPEFRRTAADGESASGRLLRGLPAEPSEPIRLALLEAATRLKPRDGGQQVATLAADPAASGKVRAVALRALEAMNSPALKEAVRTALASEDKTLLETARRLAVSVLPDEAVKLNAAVLGKGSLREQQEALATFRVLPGAEADAVLAAQLDLLNAGQLPAPLTLDLLEVAAARPAAAVQSRLSAYERRRDSTDPLARWRECLEGGDAKAGRTVFAEQAEAACMRCHKIKGEGGDVGPELAGLAAKHDRAYILQSIVEPNATIAPGYENVLVTLANGDLIAGLLSAEDADSVTLASLTDGKKQTVKKAGIKERMTVPSAMPPGLGDILGKRALRDLVEYLATVK